MSVRHRPLLWLSVCSEPHQCRYSPLLVNRATVHYCSGIEQPLSGLYELTVGNRQGFIREALQNSCIIKLQSKPVSERHQLSNIGFVKSKGGVECWGFCVRHSAEVHAFSRQTQSGHPPASKDRTWCGAENCSAGNRVHIQLFSMQYQTECWFNRAQGRVEWLTYWKRYRDKHQTS